MEYLNAQKAMAIICAIICAIASVIDPSNQLFLPIGFLNLFTYMLLCYVEGKHEKAKKKKQEQKKKDPSSKN